MGSERTTEQFAGPDEFRAWLLEHHDSSAGIWLKLAKKGSGLTSITYDEAVEVALTFGWIDGQARPGDDTYYLQGFTRRRPQSPWSRRNRDRVEALIAAGAMEPSGLAEVERARADGRWDRAYESPRTATSPADLLEALAARPAARDFFETLNSTNRYAILYRIQDAKRPETRARRIATFVDMLECGEKPYP